MIQISPHVNKTTNQKQARDTYKQSDRSIPKNNAKGTLHV